MSLNRTTTLSVVCDSFAEAAKRHRRKLQPLEDNLLLLDCGLDSLCFVDVVEYIEGKLVIDMVSNMDESNFPITFGDFVQLAELLREQRAESGAARPVARSNVQP